MNSIPKELLMLEKKYNIVKNFKKEYLEMYNFVLETENFINQNITKYLKINNRNITKEIFSQVENILGMIKPNILPQTKQQKFFNEIWNTKPNNVIASKLINFFPKDDALKNSSALAKENIDYSTLLAFKFIIAYLELAPMLEKINIIKIKEWHRALQTVDKLFIRANEKNKKYDEKIKINDLNFDQLAMEIQKLNKKRNTLENSFLFAFFSKYQITKEANLNALKDVGWNLTYGLTANFILKIFTKNKEKLWIFQDKSITQDFLHQFKAILNLEENRISKLLAEPFSIKVNELLKYREKLNIFWYLLTTPRSFFDNFELSKEENEFINDNIFFNFTEKDISEILNFFNPIINTANSKNNFWLIEYGKCVIYCQSFLIKNKKIFNDAKLYENNKKEIYWLWKEIAEIVSKNDYYNLAQLYLLREYKPVNISASDKFISALFKKNHHKKEHDLLENQHSILNMQEVIDNIIWHLENTIYKNNSLGSKDFLPKLQLEITESYFEWLTLAIKNKDKQDCEHNLVKHKKNNQIREQQITELINSSEDIR
ncbi:hypothetical protein [Spiroplasma eriocheiris]|uniref:Uncharacterized protein n=1 Tax=Spiroplasma eriocheiris TaxID=315358 RepID=A0A0H3XLC0_9MOLU|nr:hypothetical protein [Spiroplasma eriocheiris]AHF57854.1 hypothetical protein SPE_0732 [Spiroplasma eriocheiris CCTCC M 207170]AKM54299.1 hypothetical protein SERIO_v1c07360 [Spiroplasma eriocheiris]